MSPEERFWEKVEKRGPDECWLWLAFVNKGGYGGFDRRGAHLFSYELAKGRIPPDMVVRHTCDEPGCVNPAHLILGTKAENNGDRKKRGRNRLPVPRPPAVPRMCFPKGPGAQRIPVRERLLASISVHPETGCWEWQRGKFCSGYGQMSLKGKSRPAHRVCYETFVGPIPDGMAILHGCDNRACINPDHLSPGDDYQNTTDRYSRGRSPVGADHHFSHTRFIFRGEDNTKAKLTDEAVRRIRSGDLSLTDSKRLFGISNATFHKARNGSGWKHIDVVAPERKSGNLKLTDDQVLEIRQSKLPASALVTVYGVSDSLIWAIRSGVARKGVNGPTGKRENPLIRLTEEAIRFIRSSGLSTRQTMERFGVSRSTAYNVRTGRIWKHVT